MDISFSLSVSVCQRLCTKNLSFLSVCTCFFALLFPSFVVRTHFCTLSLSLFLNKKDDLHVLHGVAEQQRSIEDGVICDSHEIVSEIFERLDHGYVVVLSRVVKLNSLLPASAAAPKIKLNCAKRRSFFSFLCVLSRPNGIITLAQIFYDREHQSVIINPFFSSIHQTGIRSHKDNQKDFMNKSLQDIRAEVVSSDIRTKSIAIEKATYLHSLGFNMNWASFHVVELMSTANVKYKRVGYLAACQSFGDDTDVVLLIPNLLKKDLASPNPAEAALAISCLANIVTPELSQTLVADVYSLLNNHKPDLRRRACLCLYKCFLRYPEALRPSFARLTECLEDDDQTVVQAAVTVLSELAMHNPKTYLPLAPKFYKLLTTSSSNWMTIKLVKVFGALTPLEPRLGKKLVGPLSEILETTSAKSLMYECIRTVVQGMTSQEKIVRQAVDKL